MTVTSLHGDNTAILPTLAPGSVQTIVTSPPYFGLRDYGLLPTHWPAIEYVPMAGLPAITIPSATCCLGLEDDPLAYIGHLVHVFRLARPALRSDGTAWLNLGDSYAQDSKWGGRSGGKNYTSAAGGISRERKRTGLKDKNLMMIPARAALALQADGWYVRSDVIWAKPNCLSGGALVYTRTQKGEMPMMVKDMVRLRPETVQLWNGRQWTQVIRWIENPRPERPIELTLRNGQRIGCTPDHLWPTQRGNVRADQLQVSDVIQTCTLPEPAAPRDPRLVPASIGYFVGLYIAEGSMSGDCIQIAGHTKEVDRIEILSHMAEEYGGTCRMHATSGNSATINIHSPMLRAILDMYVGGHDASDKHLTVACWQRDNAFLRMVLRGYLAGDAHFDAKNDRYRLGFTRNYNLEADLRTLCARLGYSLRLNLSTARIGEQVYPTFRGELRMRSRADDGEIVKIAGSKARKFWDITVADDPHLFSLASGVLTHNCMPESIKDRPTRAHEYLFLLAKSERYYYDAAAVAEPLSAPSKFANEITARNRRTVWSIATQSCSGAHFAVMPEALIEPCILAGSSARACEHCGAPWVRVVERESNWQERKAAGATAGNVGRSETYQNGAHGKNMSHDLGSKTMRDLGLAPSCACADNTGSSASVVLDLYGGSGTVGKVATRLQRDAVLIDLNPDYIALQAERVDKVQVEMFV